MGRDIQKFKERGQAVSEKREDKTIEVITIKVKVSDIKPRPNQESRGVDMKHVETLKKSIEMVGLVQPISIDKHNYLIAGGHRLEAFKQLGIEEIPAYKMTEIDSVKDPDVAMNAEVIENTNRRDYSGKELVQLKEYLMSTGKYVQERTKANADMPMVNSALEVITGKNKRQINRLIATELSDADTEANGSAKEDVLKASEKIQKELNKYLDSLSKLETEESEQLQKKTSSYFNQVTKLIKVVQGEN